MRNVSIGTLFQAHESARARRIKTDPNADKDAHASASAAQVDLGMILKGCDAEIKVSDDRLGSITSFLPAPLVETVEVPS